MGETLLSHRDRSTIRRCTVCLLTVVSTGAGLEGGASCTGLDKIKDAHDSGREIRDIHDSGRAGPLSASCAARVGVPGWRVSRVGARHFSGVPFGVLRGGRGIGMVGAERVMVVPEFQTKRSDRWGDELTAWGVLDMALRGDEEQWWELYEAARRDAEVRSLLRRMLPMADPDLVGGMRLWQALLDRFESPPSPAR